MIVQGLRRTLAGLKANRTTWSKVSGTAHLAGWVPTEDFPEQGNFGSNPGALRSFVYAPPTRPIHPALVVVLHGCSQTAAAYAVNAGWKALADQYGLVLLAPQQERSNNQNACFNWFQRGDTLRDGGEVLSIRQMIGKAVADYSVDPARIYVTGLSAGGAMTSAMLACYPEIFAGGAILAGLPYGAASNVQQAFESMFQSPPRPAAEWASLVKSAAPIPHRWPRISVWHGSADTTVVPANQEEIVKQWRAVHGLLGDLPTRSIVQGVRRDLWHDESGAEIVEAYTIPGMGHGTPIASGSVPDAYGTAAPFILDVGIASSFHIARFFGLVESRVGASEASEPIDGVGKHSDARQSTPLLGHGPTLGTGAGDEHSIKATIERALKAAGLMR